MAVVTTFSVVEVGAGDEERFTKFLKEIRTYLSKQPGFISNQLYRCRAADSLQLMVVGKWESSTAIQAATMSEEWGKLMSGLKVKLIPLPFEEVIVE